MAYDQQPPRAAKALFKIFSRLKQTKLLIQGQVKGTTKGITLNDEIRVQPLKILIAVIRKLTSIVYWMKSFH